MKNNKARKGFTLIELLVVIAIIAILAVVVILTLNPAQLLAQARDSNRISDFATIKSALTLYATDVSTSTWMSSPATTTEHLYSGNASATAPLAAYDTLTTTSSQTTWGFAATSTAYPAASALIANASRAVDSTGWLPVNLNAISAGAPISSYPVDPTNSGNLMYIYAGGQTTFKVVSHMESSKYMTGGPNDVETGDGGPDVGAYEQGTGLTL